ncbi:cadherin repeat domain-containing protein, partial [bacterium]|nr:cadherin repeat domain-containing protein [bacterium]
MVEKQQTRASPFFSPFWKALSMAFLGLAFAGCETRIPDGFLGIRYESTSVTNHLTTAISLSASSMAENNSAGDLVGTLQSTDPDSDDSFTYALVAGDGDTDNSSFSVSGNELKLGVSANFEAKNSYSARVRSTDAGGLSFEQAFTISITNVNETPTAVLIVNDSSAYSSLSSTPLISWVTQAQPVGISVARYEYSLGSSAGATDVLPWQSSGTLNQAQPTGLSLTQGTRYYANVRVVSTDGEISAVVSSDGWVADTQAPTVALATPSNRAQYSGSFTLTGSCSSDDSSVVSLSYGNLSLSGPTEASCVDNAFSATLTTDRTVSLGQVTVTQSDLASNVASKSLNIAGMTEYIQLPSNRNEFTSIASNTVNDVSVVGSGPTAQVFAATSSG